MQIALSECPFCGCYPEMDISYGFNVSNVKYWNGTVSCTKCGAKFETSHRNSKKAVIEILVKKWNRRVKDI